MSWLFNQVTEPSQKTQSRWLAPNFYHMDKRMVLISSCIFFLHHRQPEPARKLAIEPFPIAKPLCLSVLFCLFLTWCVTLVIAIVIASHWKWGKDNRLSLLIHAGANNYFRVSPFSLWSIALGFQVWLCRCPSSVTCWSIALGQEYKKQDIFRVRRLPGWLGVLLLKHPS